jgi:predicted choloylglycine hydrolase
MKKIFLLTMMLIIIFSSVVLSGKEKKPGDIYAKETVVAGSKENFMMVRHVILEGSNYEIGKKIAELAQKDGVKIVPLGEPIRNRVQRRYIKKNYPVFYERMKGAADAYGLNINNDSYNFSILLQLLGNVSCSAVFYPPGLTKSGHGILSRNYDFTTGNYQGKPLQKGEVSPTARPIIFEIYPDQGYPSLFICAYELLGGVVDGINSEGLTVAILGDEESMSKTNPRMEQGSWGTGFHEFSAMRYLLDHCKDVNEAKEALLYLKHYYFSIPCHYIIADRYGNSFLFEFSPGRNRTFIIDRNGPQCITNHLVANYKEIDSMPEGPSYDIYKMLSKAIGERKIFPMDEIKCISSRISALLLTFQRPGFAPGRTLWHAIYDTEERGLRVKFYLGETTDPKDKKRIIMNYSDYLHFRLKSQKKP